MRILHAFKDYYPPTRGGVEQHVNEVAHLVPGVRSLVLTSSGNRSLVHEQDGPVEVIRAPEYLRPVSTPITPSWARLLREAEADLFHFHMPNPFGELALLASGAQVPMVASYHADIVGRRALQPFFLPFQRRFLGQAKRIIVGSSRLVDTSVALRGLNPKAVVVPYGVEPAYWATRPPEAETIRERYRGPLVAFLGRLSYYKGVDVLLHAMRAVPATCLLVGVGPLGPALKTLAARLDLTSKVVFVGAIPDDARPAYLHAADVFVLPSTSRAESFGISMLQAMACGTPAVCTELGTGTSWVNRHGSTGLVIPPSDPGALAAALRQILSDDVRRSDMAMAAAERVRSSFTRQAMLDMLRSVYASV